jgi:signal transduction histidine kinase
MHFKITARTILQLGAELISSDAIAFYELIKNAFDAASKKVEVRVVCRLPYQLSEDLIEEYCEWESHNEMLERKLKDDKHLVLKNIDNDAPNAFLFVENLKLAKTPKEFYKQIQKANYISIKDTGEGMSLKDLEDIYLTIGTRNRTKQRSKAFERPRPVLGEKGLGRLSVMRLGDSLLVESTKAGEKNYNLLEIDWDAFSHNSDDLLDQIQITPRIGKAKEHMDSSGTTITIFSLKSEWTKEKLQSVGDNQLNRFVDPFQKYHRDFITLWFNKQPLILNGIDKILFDYAHASVKAALVFEGETPIFQGSLFYRIYNRSSTFKLFGTHIASIIHQTKFEKALRDLGPFSVELYWYNRQLLRESEGIPDAAYIQELVRIWGGGLMLFRDGFRVNPYGSPADDWLSLDPKALASGGYKLNRKQIIGRVEITSSGNPYLLDQTNREGLRDNQEKFTLVSLLQHMIEEELKTFLDDVKKQEEQNLASLSLNEAEKRIKSGQQTVKEAIHKLKLQYPQIKRETDTLHAIENVMEESIQLFKTAKLSATQLNDRLKTTIELASLGLMVDVIAHELNRSTEHALRTISSLSQSDIPTAIRSTINSLKLQLKTIQTRLKVIDPLGPSGRQQKIVTDIKKLVLDALKGHAEQFKRHNIYLEVFDSSKQNEWELNVVPGMVIQIIENLISNAVYWLKQEQIIHNLKRPEIHIIFDRTKNCILMRDNGPGIASIKKEDIFRPFYSTKPPGEGRGLGLYLSREMAKYHGANLALLDEPKKDQLNTFILSFNSN